METSIFIAKIFGLSYIVIGIGFLLNRDILQKIVDNFCGNTALLFYGGVFSLVIGLTIILVHNVWAANWTVLITLIGWAGFIKGIWLILFPGSVSKFMDIYRQKNGLTMIHSVGAIVLGVILTYLGFFAA